MATILSLPRGIKGGLPVAIIMSALQLLCCLSQVHVPGCVALLRINLPFKSLHSAILRRFFILNFYKARAKTWFRVRYCGVSIRVRVRQLMVEFLRMFQLPAQFRAAAYRRRRGFFSSLSLFHSSRGLLTPPVFHFS